MCIETGVGATYNKLLTIILQLVKAQKHHKDLEKSISKMVGNAKNKRA